MMLATRRDASDARSARSIDLEKSSMNCARDV